MNSLTEDIAPKPFLRWAGGKRWLLKHIDFIKDLPINTYYEPFLGGGSVFFSTTRYKNAILSDLNPDLINAYVCLRDHLEDVVLGLKNLKNSEREYYKIRDSLPITKVARAVKFIYLNKTSFNGIYRVNSQGVFNVPFGFRKRIDLVDSHNLKLVSKRLKGVELQCGDFQELESKIKKGDFVFLDPPYTVAHENNGFVQYNQKIFSIEDQKRLAKFIQKIKQKDAYYILTNAKHKAIVDIYSEIDKPVVLERKSTVGGIGARREEFKEYLFTNCM